MTAAERRDIIIDTIRDRKGYGITILDLEDVPGAPASEFIIATGNSTTQVGSIADHLEDRLRTDAGMKPYNVDGQRNAEWVVMDYGDIWIHVFLPEARTRYSLEELWSDAAVTEVLDMI